MRDILFPAPAPSDPDPVRRAQIAMHNPLPKRFYQDVSVQPVGTGYQVVLDGKTVLTPAKRPLALPVEAAARLVAAEWAAQRDTIDVRTMPLTRLVNVGLDAVTDAREAVVEDMVAFARSDLVCYRAEEPDGLVARQAMHWTPVLDHAVDRHRARFILAAGIRFVEQPPASVDAIRAHVAAVTDPVALAALHVVVTLTGSVLIGVMLLDQAISPEAAWDAAHVDEDWTNSQWGEDAEAMARRDTRWAEFSAAAALLALMSSADR
jgi:chaperone required for assembly of F1-ATPase